MLLFTKIIMIWTNMYCMYLQKSKNLKPFIERDYKKIYTFVLLFFVGMKNKCENTFSAMKIYNMNRICALLIKFYLNKSIYIVWLNDIEIETHVPATYTCGICTLSVYILFCFYIRKHLDFILKCICKMMMKMIVLVLLVAIVTRKI